METGTKVRVIKENGFPNIEADDLGLEGTVLEYDPLDDTVRIEPVTFLGYSTFWAPVSCVEVIKAFTPIHRCFGFRKATIVKECYEYGITKEDLGKMFVFLCWDEEGDAVLWAPEMTGWYAPKDCVVIE